MTKNYIIKGTGFTLIELLIVVAILAILAGTVIMIINPGERLAAAREATRESHMVSIGQAIHLAVLDCSTPTTYCSDVQAVVLICQSASSSPENWLLDADKANCPLPDDLDNLQDPLDDHGYYIDDDGSNNVKIWAQATESTWCCGQTNSTCTNTTEGQYKRY